MRVKVRFNTEAGQPPMILDLRFLPRIGEQLHVGFRRIIEVLEVQRVDNDNRFGGIIRARYVREEGRMAPAPPPVPRPMPMPAGPLPSLGGPVAPAAAYADLNFEELAAAHGKGTKPDPTF